MHIEKFFQHHGLLENPFAAEEARHDAVFERLKDSTSTHPDFPKILGRLDQPTTSVVFGEKGSGKTAIRLLIGERVAETNAQATAGGRTLLVAYDDLNPFLDRILSRRRRLMGKRKSAKTGDEKILQEVRLVDHQDAILEKAVTQVVDALVGEGGEGRETMHLPAPPEELLRRLPRAQRLDLSILAALYDRPRSSGLSERWSELRRMLRLGAAAGLKFLGISGVVMALAAAGLFVYAGEEAPPGWVLPAGIAAGALALVAGVFAGLRCFRVRKLARRVAREMVASDRTAAELRRMLLDFKPRDLAGHPWPLEGMHDSRYQLTNRLLEVLKHFGYSGILVLVDRVDEPSAVAGRVGRMRSVVWPLLDHKFLQQQKVGVKLLLPIELRHLVHRESSDFFQEARLDKQNLVDRLSWSGATLYDLCTHRLKACRSPEAPGTIALTDLFEENVTRELLVDALDQMQQPRDAFKFLYSAVMEHCRTIPEDEPSYRIHRLTLDAARRQHAQRLADLSRGYSPA